MLGVVGVNVGADCWEEERGNVRGLYPGGRRLEEILLEVNGSEWRRSMEGRWQISDDGRGGEEDWGNK